MERALKLYEGQMQVILYPVTFGHGTSVMATQAALCAGEQGQFWAFHHLLYERQKQWSQLPDPLDRMAAYAKDVGIDAAALQSCVQSGRMKSLVSKYDAEAREVKVQSTPTVFVNTKRLVGAHEEELLDTIRREVARVRRTAQ